MLNKLSSKGTDLGFFETIPMKDLKHSCAKDANVEVIDYDKAKEILYGNLNQGILKLNQTKSCDALKIMPALEQMDFIEIKGIKDFCEKLRHIDSEGVTELIEKQTQKFSLAEKIEQSVDILKLILQIGRMGFSNIEKEKILNEVRKDYIVVIDEEIENDASRAFAATMDFLSNSSNYKDEVILQLQNCIDNITHARINKPILMPQSKVDTYYNSIIPIPS